MPAAGAPGAPDVTPLLEAKRYDEVEEIWMKRLDDAPTDLDFFLPTAKELRRRGERGRANTLLALLEETLAQKRAARPRLAVLKEIARLASGSEPGLLEKLGAGLEAAYAPRPSLGPLAKHYKLRDAASPAEALERLEKIERWLPYDVGQVFAMAGRGAGQVTETNLALELVRLDFERDKRIAIPIGQAGKVLTPLPPDSFWRRKLEDPEPLRALAVESPSGLVREALAGVAKGMTTAEIKEAVSGLVPDARWTSFWTAARKHPQLLASGSGAKAIYRWSGTAALAEESLMTEFASATPRRRLEIVRKNPRAPLGATFSAGLAEAAAKVARTEPGLAYELIASMPQPDKLSETLARELLIRVPAADLLGGIGERAVRERALRELRALAPDRWPEVYREAFRREEDVRSLAFLYAALDTDAPAERDTLLDQVFGAPRRHPRAFLWCCREARNPAYPAIAARVGYDTLVRLLDLVEAPEFAPLRAKTKELFDRGGLAVDIIAGRAGVPQKEGAVDFLAAIEHKATLEEYRRELLRGALLMAHPELRAPQEGATLYSTPEARERKKQELENLQLVEIPTNRKAIEVAREMGDLRENFEYKAARQRHEYLNARVAALTEELRRTRDIDPAAVSSEQVRVGARVTLAGDSGERVVTILGPWDADPASDIYSYESDIGRDLIGRAPGETAVIDGKTYTISTIAPWTSLL